MAGCGCVGTCDCFIEGQGTVTVTGSGDVTDPYVVTGTETEFDLVSTTNALAVTAGGPSGHTPSIDIVLDPDGTAPVEVTPAGLKIDCCGDVDEVVSPDECNELVDAGNGLFVDSGMSVVDPGVETLVSIPTTGGTSGVSWERDITNNEDCDMLVQISGQPLMQGEITAGGDVELNAVARMQITSAHTWVGGGSQRSQRVNYYVDSADAVVSKVLSWIWSISAWAVIPAGETFSVETVAITQLRSFLNTASGSGFGYTFQSPAVLVMPYRRTDLDVVGS